MTYRYPGGVIRKNAANTAITGASGVWDLGSQAQAVRNNTWPISGLANPVSGSLRFRSSASAYLSRTPAGAGNQKTWTWSAWVKRGVLSSSDSTLFNAGTTGIGTNDTGFFGIRFTSDNQLNVTTGVTNLRNTTQVFRDPSAWYHIVVSVDTTQATSSNRIKVYVNGTQVTAFSTSNDPSLNLDTAINNNVIHEIGRTTWSGTTYFDGYMAEINLIDGQALTPASFGQTSAITGVWEPIKYTGTYGTNGFYLSLSDTSSIGKDFSGRGNNWSPNNISTTSGATFDLMRDVPTQYTPQGVTDVGGTVRGNYCTFNPLDKHSTITMAEGNLKVQLYALANGNSGYRGTIGVSSGKWYWEVLVGANQASRAIGFIGIDELNTPISAINTVGTGSLSTSYAYRQFEGNKYNNNTGTAYGASYTTGDVIGVALDMDARTLTFYKNGVSQGQAFSGITAGTYAPSGALYSDTVNGSYIADMQYNFGQRPFTYTPPSGFKSLCTTNLPTPTIGATVATAANKNFDATLYTGNDTGQSVTNAGAFQPSLIWYKARSAAYYHTLIDDIRGAGTRLFSNLTDGESNDGVMTSFNSNGFTLGTNDGEGINKNAVTYVAWQWKGATSNATNTSGSITSNVRANPTAGFSIVTYTGNFVASTIGHGLGVVPSMIICKVRSSSGYDWHTYHASLGATKFLSLNSSSAAGTASSVWNNTVPTSSVFSVADNGATNLTGGSIVAYCFAQIAGYSAFGSYTGNLNADGPFAYTGFRPKFIMWKRSDSTGDWIIFDTVRDTYNYTQNQLIPNTSGAEAVTGGGFVRIDFLSNGFKIRSTDSYVNASGGTYIYMAFAEHPFKNSLAR